MMKHSNERASEEAQRTEDSARIFPEDSSQLESMLIASESVPLEDCVPMMVAVERLREAEGWIV